MCANSDKKTQDRGQHAHAAATTTSAPPPQSNPGKNHETAQVSVHDADELSALNTTNTDPYASISHNNVEASAVMFGRLAWSPSNIMVL